MAAAGGEGTSIVERVFGGLLRSDVTCCSCNYTSTAYDPFLDISLDMCALPPVPAPPGAPPRSHFFGTGPKGSASKGSASKGSASKGSASKGGAFKGTGSKGAAAGDKKRRNSLLSTGVLLLHGTSE